MPKFKKIPVEIEALQLTPAAINEVMDWIAPAGCTRVEKGLIIATIEGDMLAGWGDWVIKGVKGEFYPCKNEIFKMTYETPLPVDEGEKTLDNTSASQAQANVKDIEFWGNGDTFLLISKASSQKQGWMKSTKAMQIDGVGVVVQVTTQQRNPDGSNAVAEAVTFIPGVNVLELRKETDGPVVARGVVKIQPPSPDQAFVGENESSNGTSGSLLPLTPLG